MTMRVKIWNIRLVAFCSTYYFVIDSNTSASSIACVSSALCASQLWSTLARPLWAERGSALWLVVSELCKRLWIYVGVAALWLRYAPATAPMTTCMPTKVGNIFIWGCVWGCLERERKKKWSTEITSFHILWCIQIPSICVLYTFQKRREKFASDMHGRERQE